MKKKIYLITLERRKVTQCVSKWTKCMCMKESTFFGWGSLLYFKSSLVVLHLIISKLTTKDKQGTFFVAVLLSHRWIATLTGGQMISIGAATPLARGQHLVIRARSDLV